MNGQKKKGRFGSFLYAVFWFAVIGMFAGLTVNQASQYRYYRGELDKVLEELAEEQAAYAQLMDQKPYYESDAYIEQLAREQLGYVKPDELVFINQP